MLNRKLTVAAIAFALIIGIFAVGSFNADAAKTVAFEYQLIGMRLQPRSEMVNGKKVLTAPGMTSELNFQGAEGWEYVNTIPGADDAYFVVLKRKK